MSEILDIHNQDHWDAFVLQHQEVNFLHSWQWGEFHRARGKKVVRRGLFIDNELIAVYTGQVETARRGTYLAIAGGPIVNDWHNDSAVQALFSDIRALAQDLKCDFVRIRPQLEKSDFSEKLFTQLGLKKAPMHLSVEHAGVLDLRQSEEEIMAAMSQSLRRKIRKAQKAGIDIRVNDSEEDLQNFYEIHNQHAERQGYVPFNESFLKKQFAAFKETGNVLLYTASKDGVILAQNYMIFYGPEASYHYGVSTQEGTRLSSAPLLHLKAMEDARQRGCIRYNFWGVVDEDATKHRFYGVSQFKRSFGIQEIKHLPAHDMVVRRLPYLRNWIIETIRRKYRKL